MIEVLFGKIPQILFEPIAVCGMLGLILAFVLQRKQKSDFFWFAAVSILFMIVWRVLIQIVSSRYAVLLLYPATIGTVYLCFKVPEFLNFIPEKWRKLLPYGLMAALTLACVGKDLHVNPYDDYLIRCGTYLRENAAPDASVLCYSAAVTRIEYYSGRKTLELHPKEDTAPEIERAVLNRKPDWLVLNGRKQENIRNCTLVQTYDLNRKKKKKVYLYRVGNASPQ